MPTIQGKPPAHIRRNRARAQVARYRVGATDSPARQQENLIRALETRGCPRDLLEARLKLLRITCDYFALGNEEVGTFQDSDATFHAVLSGPTLLCGNTACRAVLREDIFAFVKPDEPSIELDSRGSLVHCPQCSKLNRVLPRGNVRLAPGFRF